MLVYLYDSHPGIQLGMLFVKPVRDLLCLQLISIYQFHC